MIGHGGQNRMKKKTATTLQKRYNSRHSVNFKSVWIMFKETKGLDVGTMILSYFNLRY